ncbi:MAG: PilN domain-containing protein [Gemmatimonadota bacterium]|nr:PilN domain-containing protein [Gemmatimonadota bacterium]
MPRLGIALGERLLVARLAGKATEFRAELPPLRDDPAVWADVAQALGGIVESLALPDHPTVDIALLPPLVQLRRIELPRLRQQERLRVIARDAARYFGGIAEPQVVGVHLLDARRRSPEALLVAATPSWLLDRLAALAVELDWRIHQVIPAHVAWIDGKGAGSMAVAGVGTVELIAWSGSQLTGVRRTPATAERVVAAVKELQRVGSVSLVGSLASDAALGAALAASGSPVIQLPAVDPAALAATHAGRRSTLELVPDPVIKRRRAWARTVTHRLLAGAAALLLGAVGLVRWDLRQELAAVSTARAAVREEVAAALASRDSLELMRGTLTVLAQAETTAPRWTTLLGALASHLPDDGSLTSLEAVGDSVALEGQADEAGDVFVALRQASMVAWLQASSPIRQEADGDAPPIEHFTVTLRLRPTPGIVKVTE